MPKTLFLFLCNFVKIEEELLLYSIYKYLSIELPCDWMTNTGKPTTMLCTNGAECDVALEGWDCCKKMESKRLRCPSSYPDMCASNGKCGGDHCCSKLCNNTRTCQITAMAGNFF